MLGTVDCSIGVLALEGSQMRRVDGTLVPLAASDGVHRGGWGLWRRVRSRRASQGVPGHLDCGQELKNGQQRSDGAAECGHRADGRVLCWWWCSKLPNVDSVTRPRSARCLLTRIPDHCAIKPEIKSREMIEQMETVFSSSWTRTNVAIRSGSVRS